MNVSVLWFVFLACCQTGDFKCNIEIKDVGNIIITPNEEFLSKQDTVLITVPDHEVVCIPSKFYNKTGIVLNTLAMSTLKIRNN